MMDSAQFPVENISSPSQAHDIELEIKVKKASERISENLHIFANEPSLACYRLQEHIQKSLPQLVTRKLEVNQIQRELQGKCYDLEYSINALKTMQKSQEPFQTTQTLLHNATVTVQLISRSDMPKVESKKKPAASMYQRFSGSFDLPASFLPSGLSSSVSASADLKSTSGIQRTLPNSRRARASSVSSTPNAHASGSQAQPSSSSPVRKKSTSP